jgi:ATP-dependent Lon protease
MAIYHVCDHEEKQLHFLESDHCLRSFQKDPRLHQSVRDALAIVLSTGQLPSPETITTESADQLLTRLISVNNIGHVMKLRLGGNSTFAAIVVRFAQYLLINPSERCFLSWLESKCEVNYRELRDSSKALLHKDELSSPVHSPDLTRVVVQDSKAAGLENQNSIARPKPTFFKVFDIGTIERLEVQAKERYRSKDSAIELAQHEEATELAMKFLGQRRVLAITQAIEAKFDLLRKKYPNGVELIDRVHAALTMLWISNGESDGLKVVVDGPPGVGKTALCREICGIVGTSFFSIDVSTLTAGFILTGMDRSWRNGKYGSFYKIAAQCDEVSPFVLLDEIDKLSGHEKYAVENCLLQLLEPNNARNLRDEYLDVSFDASKWIVVCTSNEVHKLSEPLRSRLNVLHMNAPTADQALLIVRAIVGEYKHFQFEQEVLEAVATQSSDLRQAKQMLSNAMQTSLLHSNLATKLESQEHIERIRVKVEHLKQMAGTRGFRPGFF